MNAKRIIIVEDDTMISEIYQRKFTESGFQVFPAYSGDEAVKVAKKEPADIMILDIIMPKMDGFQVIDAVRNKLKNKDIKIFIFSNLSQREDQEKAQKLGADGFIVKAEYSPSELVKEVNRLFNQYQEMEKNEERKKRNEMPEAKNREKKKILLIEDEKIFLEMFGGKLKQDGYDVDTAANGAWGLKEAFKNKYDLFIIDMIMPMVTGDEIVQKLKDNEATKNIPIIVLSASVENNVAEKVRQMGISAFFLKTQIIPSELSKKVTELIGE
jgi:DNA-binding response OmpR family regulator